MSTTDRTGNIHDARGRFAGRTHQEPAGGLHALTAGTRPDEQQAQVAHLRKVLEECMARVTARKSATNGGDVASLTSLQLRGMAARVRLEYPHARYMELEVSDQCDDVLWVGGVAGQDRTSLVGDCWPELGDEVEDLGTGIDPVTVQHAAACVDYDRRQGRYLIDLDLALRPPEGPGSNQVREAAGRAAEVIDGYRAVYDDLDLDEASVARDLLADLHHWARQRQIDIGAVFEQAAAHATQEQAAGI